MCLVDPYELKIAVNRQSLMCKLVGRNAIVIVIEITMIGEWASD